MDPALRETRREDRRDAILDVAQACFVAEGYGATSMSTIAARLGGSKGTLYNYFRSKEELFEAMVRRACGLMQREFASLPPQGDMRAWFVSTAEGFLAHLLSPGFLAIQRLVIAEGQRFPELAEMYYQAGPRPGIARAAEVMERLMDEGRLRRGDPVVVANNFRDLALSGAYFLRIWGVVRGEMNPEERRARAEIAVDTFLRAYAP